MASKRPATAMERPPSDADESEKTPGPQSKVSRVIEEYDLESASDYIESAWTQSEDRKSLRQLAEDLNRRILRSAMADAGLDPIEEDVDSAYRALTEESTAGSTVQKERELERDGVDVEALHRDFVSHQAVHTYLRNYLRVEPPERTDDERLQSERERLDRLKGRATAVAEDTLTRLRDADRLAVDEFDVITTIDVYCERCKKSYAVDEILENGGCPCREETG
ncbi:MAG: rod-determining factor RdfA [Halodesulfurarchaeum sp.]